MGHSHDHDHGDSSSTPCTGHSHDHHDHEVHQATDDTQERDIDLWSANGNIDVQRLNKSHGLLDHSHEGKDEVLKKLRRASILCATFLLVEVVGGFWSGSLAILSDASHLCADLASFAVAIGASYLASLPKTASYTFGLKRVESLAALLSMLSLAFISVALGIEAIHRIINIVSGSDNVVQVEGFLMSGIAFIGVLVNVALAFVLGEHHVHLPSDSGGCGSHDHAHGHGHSGGHQEEKAAKNSHGNGSSSNCGGHHGDGDDDDHGHSHGHAHGHDHSDANEATPLMTNNGNINNKSSLTRENSYEHNQEHRQGSGDDHNVGAPIPFLPKNINLQAAYLHVLGDLAQSVAVLIAGLVIWAQPTWTIIDPICTLLFCALVGYSTVGVLRTSIAVLLQEVPPSVNWKDVYDAIDGIDGVENVHDLHIWSISHGIPTLSVHCNAEEPEAALEQIYTRCRDFGIVHATIQVQSQSGECVTCTDRICRLCQYAEEKEGLISKNGSGVV